VDLENFFTTVMPVGTAVALTLDAEEPPVLRPATEKTYDPDAGYYYDPLVSTTGFSIYR